MDLPVSLAMACHLTFSWLQYRPDENAVHSWVNPIRQRTHLYEYILKYRIATSSSGLFPRFGRIYGGRIYGGR